MIFWKAQFLSGPITSLEKLKTQPEQTLILCSDTSGRALGFIKYGPKHLYFFTKKGKSVDLDCTCVLDFFVSEDIQRRGLGLMLFRKMLEVRKVLQSFSLP